MLHDDGQGIEIPSAGSQIRLGLERIIPQLQPTETHLDNAPLNPPNPAQTSPEPLSLFEQLLDKPKVQANLTDDIAAAPGRILRAGVDAASELFRRVRG